MFKKKLKNFLKRIKSSSGYVLKNKSGAIMFWPSLAWFLTFLAIFVVLSQRIKANIIQTRIRDEAQEEQIKSIIYNYANTYHTVRESYGSGFLPNGSGFSENYSNEIINVLADKLGLERDSNGYYSRYVDENIFYSITDVEISIYTPDLASGDILYINTVIKIEIPMNYILLRKTFSTTVSISTTYNTVF